jgi:hypothetical protein
MVSTCFGQQEAKTISPLDATVPVSSITDRFLGETHDTTLTRNCADMIGFLTFSAAARMVDNVIKPSILF